jgi:hypothetical protein
LRIVLFLARKRSRLCACAQQSQGEEQRKRG